MSDFIARVRDGLHELRKIDPGGKRTFGSDSHVYRLNPVIPEPDLAAFEREHACRLPADYRALLAQLGNGGAGPFYGLFKLGEVDGWKGDGPWFIGDLARPFPHVAQWNLPPDELERMAELEDATEIHSTYWHPVDGAIPICHEGCALRDWLVVTGPEAGNVWQDLTFEFGGWSPCLRPDGLHATFADWYLAWLDEALRPRRVVR